MKNIIFVLYYIIYIIWIGAGISYLINGEYVNANMHIIGAILLGVLIDIRINQEKG